MERFHCALAANSCFIYIYQEPYGSAVLPVDFENYISSAQNSGDSHYMAGLWDFPKDDIGVHLLRRDVRTIAPIVPEHGYVDYAGLIVL